MTCTCCPSCRLDRLETVLPGIVAQLETISDQQAATHARLDHTSHLLLERIHNMASKIEELTAQVAENRTVTGSALTLIRGFSAQLDAAIAAARAGDDQALDQLSASLKSDDDPLAAAVAANTPPTPPTP